MLIAALIAFQRQIKDMIQLIPKMMKSLVFLNHTVRNRRQSTVAWTISKTC